jgi:hypothetical protein
MEPLFLFVFTSYFVTLFGLVDYWVDIWLDKRDYISVTSSHRHYRFWTFKNVTVRKVAIVTLLFPISSPILLSILILKCCYWAVSPIRYLFRVAIFGKE